MRFLFLILSIVIGIIGLIFIVLGGIYPAKYQKTLSEPTTAVQVTQIYTEATHTLTVGIGIVSLAVLMAVIGILFSFNSQRLINEQTPDDIQKTLWTSETTEPSSEDNT